MQRAKTLIRLGGCPGRSESSLGAHAILLVLSRGGSYSNDGNFETANFIIGWDKQTETEKISDSHRKGYSWPMCENDLEQMMKSQIKIFLQQCPLSCSNNRNNIKNDRRETQRECQCGIRTRDFQAQKTPYRFSVLSPRLT